MVASPVSRTMPVIMKRQAARPPNNGNEFTCIDVPPVCSLLQTQHRVPVSSGLHVLHADAVGLHLHLDVKRRPLVECLPLIPRMNVGVPVSRLSGAHVFAETD